MYKHCLRLLSCMPRLWLCPLRHRARPPTFTPRIGIPHITPHTQMPFTHVEPAAQPDSGEVNREVGVYSV
jgi:hypothetical protein